MAWATAYGYHDNGYSAWLRDDHNGFEKSSYSATTRTTHRVMVTANIIDGGDHRQMW